MISYWLCNNSSVKLPHLFKLMCNLGKSGANTLRKRKISNFAFLIWTEKWIIYCMKWEFFLFSICSKLRIDEDVEGLWNSTIFSTAWGEIIAIEWRYLDIQSILLKCIIHRWNLNQKPDWLKAWVFLLPGS